MGTYSGTHSTSIIVKITAAVCLLLFLVLFGCSSQNIEHNASSISSSTAGSATEYDVALPDSVEEIAALSCSKDGKIIYALAGGAFSNSSEASSDDVRTLLWATKDQGTTWERLYDLPAEINAAGVVSGSINADGDCFVAVFTNEALAQADGSGMPEIDFFYIGQNGDFFEVGNEFGLVDAVNVSFVANDRVLIDDYSNAFLVDTVSKEIVAKYDAATDLGMSIASAPVSDDTFVIFGYESAQCYVGLTGEPCDAPVGLTSMFNEVYADQPQSVVFYNSGKILYCANAKGVYKYSTEEDGYEKLVSFTELMLGGGEPYLMSLAVDEENTSYLTFFSPNLMSTAFKAYGLAGSGSSDETSVSVYSLESNSLLNSAILQFRDSNPEIKWSVEVGIDGEKATTAEDAIKQLNARLLAGNGPDVILLDGLPIDSYIDKKILADLSGVLGSEEDVQEAYFSNVVSTYSQDGRTYALPTSFYFYGAQGSESFIEQGSDVKLLADELVREADAGLFRGYQNQYGFDGSFNKFNDTVRVLYGLYSPNLVKDGRLDSVQLETYFSSCKALQIAMGEEAVKTSIQEGAPSILYQALDSIDGSSQNGIGVVAGTIDMSALLQQQRSSKAAWWPIPTTAACFEPHMTVGISSSSSHKNEAEKLVRHMLGKEFQSDLTTPLPVEKEAFKSILTDAHSDDHVDEQEEGKLLYEMILGDDRSIYVYVSEDESEIASCVNAIELLTESVNGDAVIQEAVLQSLESYLDGSATLSQAVSATENKVNLYLAE